MTGETQTPPLTPVDVPHLFRRVLVGVDRSPASVEAARQAARLTGSAGTLTLLGAWTVPAEPIGVVAAGDSNPPYGDLREPAEQAVAAAESAIAGLAIPITQVVRGVACRC